MSALWRGGEKVSSWWFRQNCRLSCLENPCKWLLEKIVQSQIMSNTKGKYIGIIDYRNPFMESRSEAASIVAEASGPQTPKFLCLNILRNGCILTRHIQTGWYEPNFLGFILSIVYFEGQGTLFTAGSAGGVQTSSQVRYGRSLPQPPRL